MIVTSSSIEGKHFDLCILGAGPAGIILALEYSRLSPGKRVLLAEYGSSSVAPTNRLDDSIQITNPVNHHPPYECTNKGLGGSSATWGGRCVMYDDVDFMERAVVEGGCTWDTALWDDVKTYVPEASHYFECGSGPFNIRDMPEYAGTRIAEGFTEGDVTDSVVERWSMPTRFGNRYREQLESSQTIYVVEGIEARSFPSPPPDSNVKFVELCELKSNKTFTAEADTFVIAAGCQETTRLLLRSPGLFEVLGGPPESLGQYYQGHVSGKISSIRFYGDPRKTDFGFQRDQEGVYFRRRFQFTAEALCRENLLNTALWLDNPLYYDPKHQSGAMSFMYLAMIMPILGKKLAPPAVAFSITKGKITGIQKHLWNIIKGLPGSLLTPASIFFKRYCLKRKLPGVFLFSPANRYALHFHAEQVPDKTNRMELAGDGESLIIHYHLAEADVQSVIRTHELLDEYLRKCGCGELEWWYPKEELPEIIRQISRDGIHQSGTTRIADSPSLGVVDSDLKVWGTDNVYVCSSSVFPTSGQANPTFLLGVFAARLAKKLSSHHA